MIETYNIDCMELLRSLPDKSISLILADPMYDISTSALVPGNSVTKEGVVRKHVQQAKKLASQNTVGLDFFAEIKRVGVNQIVWGENYFNYPDKPKGRIVWDKKNDGSRFSNCEIASCSIREGVRIFRYRWNGMIREKMGKDKEERIHAFQKPVDLYMWTLKNYAKPGDTILDTHGGSFSSAIACYNMGFDLKICEIDPKIYADGLDRLNVHRQKDEAAPTLFPSYDFIGTKQHLINP